MTRKASGERLVIAAACGASFLVYALTVTPSLNAGDGGEFVTSTHALGIVHPTGYPLYMLLGRAFETLIPFGEIAFRLAFTSGNRAIR